MWMVLGFALVSILVFLLLIVKFAWVVVESHLDDRRF